MASVGEVCRLYEPEEKSLKNSKGEEEQIDLLFKVEDKLFVCEAKCIHYPMESIDIHNMFRRLEEEKQGIDQARRKASFIKKYAHEFKSLFGGISHQEVVPLIITNYPICSGYIRNEVLIVDITTLLSYFSPEKYGIRKSNKDILSYLQCPPDVEEQLGQMQLRYIPQTVKGMGVNIYCMDPYIPSIFEPIRQTSGNSAKVSGGLVMDFINKLFKH